MNMTEVVHILKTEKECVERQGTIACPNRDCEKCDLLLPTADVLKAYTLAIGCIEGGSVHGEWKQISPAKIYECSVCGGNVMTNDIEAYDFCHHCGADMRKEQSE